MIRFRNLVFEDYFIDEHSAVITDINGNVLKQHYYGYDYPVVYLHGIKMKVHQLQAHTKWGYNPELVVHHKDKDKTNNDVDNLDYTMTPQKHNELNVGENNGMYGKTHTAEARANIKAKNTGKKRTDEQKERYKAANIGKKNPMFGKRVVNGDKVAQHWLGYHWWIKKGEKPIHSKECPGEGWIRGRVWKEIV